MTYNQSVKGQILSIFIIFFALLLPTEAQACKPGRGSDIFKSDAENLKKQSFVFLGKTISNITKTQTAIPYTSSLTGKFQIIKLLKGKHDGATLTYFTKGNSCGFSHSEGAVMLIFANKNKDGSVHLTALTPSKRFKTEAAGLKAANRLQAASKNE